MERQRTNSVHNRFATQKQRASDIVDDSRVAVNCSSCRAPLAEAWVTRPDFPMVTTLTADCPHCGDKSFEVSVKGEFYLGNTEYTNMVDQETESPKEDAGVFQQRSYLRTEIGDKAWPE